jgi:hypothetical protein
MTNTLRATTALPRGASLSTELDESQGPIPCIAEMDRCQADSALSYLLAGRTI